MQVACLRCLPARKPLRRFSTLRRFPPFLPCRTPVRSISDTHPVDIGHRSGPNRTPFRSHRKTVRHQSGRLSDFNRNTVRFESERCPTSNRIGVRFASEYARLEAWNLRNSFWRNHPLKGRQHFLEQVRVPSPVQSHPQVGPLGQALGRASIADRGDGGVFDTPDAVARSSSSGNRSCPPEFPTPERASRVTHRGALP